MEKKEILVSLCIPSFNRDYMLKYLLNHYVGCSEFDDTIEIVISDNASTDSTQQMVSDFIKQYPSKNIRYYRNEKNIGAKNFMESIRHAKGKYAKMCNDYLYIANDGLRQVKEYVRKTKEDTGLFFYDHLRDPNDGFITLNSVDAFVHLVNNKITWVSNFGCWTKDIPALEAYTQSNYKVDEYIIQISFWALYLVDQYNETHVVDFRYNQCLPVPNSKRLMKYNFFTPHVVYYYDMINDYAKEGKVSEETIHFDKKRLLSDFVGMKIVEYLILKKDCPFDLTGSWSLIYKYFGKIPYFYYIIPRITIVSVIFWPSRRMAKTVLKKLGLFETCKKLLKR